MHYTKSMIIGIDGNEANVERKVGVSEYSFELIRAFSQMSENISFRVYLKAPCNDSFPQQSAHFTYSVFGPSKLWTQIALPLKLLNEKNKVSVFFSPGHYAPRFTQVPRVISIMDLAFFHFADYFTKKDLAQLHSWTKYSVIKAKKIITISEATKSDIIKFYKVPGEKIHVIYPGIKPSLSSNSHMSNEDLKKKYAIDSKFILFVGTLQPRKNIARLIEAFSLQNDKEVKLVIVGKKGWKYEEILEAPKKFGCEEKVVFLNFVPEQDLQVLYKNAELFAFPSLYEGFGLPVLEAMKFNCPVLTSNVSSLPEAGGDAAHYCNPESTESIKEGIEKIIEDRKYRENLIEKGKENIKKFSWEKAAKETLAVLTEVGNNNK